MKTFKTELVKALVLLRKYRMVKSEHDVLYCICCGAGEYQNCKKNCQIEEFMKDFEDGVDWLEK